MTSVNELNTGGKSHDWKKNDTVTGVVVKVEQQQKRDMDTGAPVTWDDGRARMQWVFTLQAQPPNDDDDGLRNIYAQGGNYTVATGRGEAMQPAIFGAYRKAGISEIEGAILTVKNTGAGQPLGRGKNGPRLYSAKVERDATPVPADTTPDDEPW